ncbi:hypothetical protein PSPO01_15690 [Paraphaeosphaeria sporulosa]
MNTNQPTNQSLPDKLEHDENTRWLRECGWPRWFACRPLHVIAATSQLPSPKHEALYLGSWNGSEWISCSAIEAKLLKLVELVGRALDRCEETLLSTTRVLRCWLRSWGPHYCPIPFELPKRQATRNKYRSYCYRFLAVFRARQVCLAQGQDAYDIYGLTLAASQAEIVDTIWAELDNFLPDKAGSALSNPLLPLPPLSSCLLETIFRLLVLFWTDKEERLVSEQSHSVALDDELDHDENTDWLRGQNMEGTYGLRLAKDQLLVMDSVRRAVAKLQAGSTTPALAPFLELVFQLSLLFWIDVATDGVMETKAVVHFSGVLGIHPNELAFRSAYNYTPYSLATIWSLETPWPERAAYANQAERFCGQIRPRSLQRGSVSPIGYLIERLQHGRAIAKHEGPRTDISRSPDGQTLEIEGGHISLQQFRQTIHHLTANLEQTARALMLDWWPQVVLRDIKDDLSTHRPGYSFLSHPLDHMEGSFKHLSRRGFSKELDFALQGRGREKALSYLESPDRLVILYPKTVPIRGKGPRQPPAMSKLACPRGQGKKEPPERETVSTTRAPGFAILPLILPREHACNLGRGNPKVSRSSNCQANTLAFNPLTFVASERVIVCTPCKVAVPYQHIDTHLRDGHRFRAALRRTIAAQFDGLPAVRNIADLKPLFKTVNWDRVRRHAKKDHGINAVDCRQRKSEMSYALQSWTKYSRAYWIVDKSDQPAPMHLDMYAGSRLSENRPNNQEEALLLL